MSCLPPVTRLHQQSLFSGSQQLLQRGPPKCTNCLWFTLAGFTCRMHQMYRLQELHNTQSPRSVKLVEDLTGSGPPLPDNALVPWET